MRRNARQHFDHILKSFGVRRSSLTTDGDPCSRYQLLLTAYADGQLGEKRSHVIEGHLNACPSCRASLAATRIVGHCMFERPAPEFTGDMSARLRMAIAEEARTPTRVPLFGGPRLIWSGAALTTLIVAAVSYQLSLQPPVAHVAVNPPVIVHTSPFPSSAVVPSVKSLPHTAVIAKAPSAYTVDVFSHETEAAIPPIKVHPALVATPKAVVRSGAQIAATTAARHITPTVQVAKASVSRPIAPPSAVAVSPVVPSAPDQVATSDNTSLTPAPEVAPATVDRAPNNVVAHEPEPVVSSAVFETAPSEPVSLGHRLHNAGRLATARVSVYVDQPRTRVGNGTASIVDAGFK